MANLKMHDNIVSDTTDSQHAISDDRIALRSARPRALQRVLRALPRAGRSLTLSLDGDPRILARARARLTDGRSIMAELHHAGTTIVPRSLLAKVRKDSARTRAALAGRGEPGARAGDGWQAVRLVAHLYANHGADGNYWSPERLQAEFEIGARYLYRVIDYAGLRRELRKTTRGDRGCWALQIPQSVDELVTTFVMLPAIATEKYANYRGHVFRASDLRGEHHTYSLEPIDVWLLAELSRTAEADLARNVLAGIATDQRASLVSRRSRVTLSSLAEVVGRYRLQASIGRLLGVRVLIGDLDSYRIRYGRPDR